MAKLSVTTFKFLCESGPVPLQDIIFLFESLQQSSCSKGRYLKNLLQFFQFSLYTKMIEPFLINFPKTASEQMESISPKGKKLIELQTSGKGLPKSYLLCFTDSKDLQPDRAHNCRCTNPRHVNWKLKRDLFPKIFNYFVLLKTYTNTCTSGLFTIRK